MHRTERRKLGKTASKVPPHPIYGSSLVPPTTEVYAVPATPLKLVTVHGKHHPARGPRYTRHKSAGRRYHRPLRPPNRAVLPVRAKYAGNGSFPG